MPASVTTASYAKDALRLLGCDQVDNNSAPPFDLVLTDILMSPASGLDLVLEGA